MDLNEVQLLGRLTREPELKQTPSGVNVATFSIATGKKWKDKNSGEQKESVEYHNVVAWNRTAEIVGQYLHKGSQVLIKGSLQTRTWDDKDTQKKMYRTEVIVDKLIMVGSKDGQQQGQAQNYSQQPVQQNQTIAGSIDVEDIPFE